MVVIEGKSTLRLQFFSLLFEDNEGFVCVFATNPRAPKTLIQQKFYQWPLESQKMENWILSQESGHNIYFCVNLLDKRQRNKESCLPTDLLWADLDNAPEDALDKLPPQIVISSSPNRKQAIWKLSTKLPAYQAEDYSRRIAYAINADPSGWDLTQLLRVPFTRNFKYSGGPEVKLERALSVKAPPLLFEALLPVVDETEADNEPLPDNLPDLEQVLYKYNVALNKTAFRAIYTQQPDADSDWSKVLWRLIHICLEAGMSQEEAFVIARGAACNKYERDGRPIIHLWREVQKASSAQKKLTVIVEQFGPLTMPRLTEETPTGDDFVSRYGEWARESTDAVPHFHDLCATMLLSAIVANSVRLEASHGTIVPNLWGLILGDSTLTRKTTAMKMVVDILVEIDKSMIVATEGTAEGLLSALEQRPNRVSMFHKDEISGFFESINKKDYLAGMPETLTALYDVPPVFTRRLRKETIYIESPAFIFFGGGVREKVYEAINESYVLSGFLPRFLVIAGDTDLTKLRRTGPPTEASNSKRSRLVNHVYNLYEQYSVERDVNLAGQIVKMPPRVTALLTPAAWQRYGDIEELMVHKASESNYASLALPTFERLSRSLLKMALIFGAERQIPSPETSQIVIDVKDVELAAWYIQDWGRYSIDLIQNAGLKTSEKLLSRIVAAVEKNPGVLRSTLMQHYHLNSREASEILTTLEDRQLLRKEVQGRGFRYFLT